VALQYLVQTEVATPENSASARELMVNEVRCALFDARGIVLRHCSVFTRLTLIPPFIRCLYSRIECADS
jgi:hypothetical protein